MNDSFTLSVGQAHEVEKALARNDWTPALLKKATKGDFFAQVRLVLEGKAEIVKSTVEKATVTVIQKEIDLLKLVKEVILSATTEKEISKSFPIGPRYYHRDADINRWLSKVQPAGMEGKLSVWQLEKELTFKEMAQALLGVDEESITNLSKALIANGHTVVPSQIEAFIERAEAGEKTGLNTDGWANFFLVEDKNGGVSVVGVVRLDGQWDVDVYRLGYAYRWGVGRRFFSRN
jgi:hypothetical protein